MRLLIYCCLALVLFSGCSANNVEEDDSIGKHFKNNGAEGTFALYNNSTGIFTVYNLEQYRDSLYTPASTFKIVNALVGLQTGRIVDEKMVIPWDGKVRSNADWNRDLNMHDAFRVSAVPYFQEVARRIGKDTMQQWLDTLSYGTGKITSAIDTFWLDGSLKIRPDEQMGLIKKLYFNKLPFQTRVHDIVKNAMLMEATPVYKLSYKTGSLSTNGGSKQEGWIIGWIEENKRPYFFVMHLASSNPSFNMQTTRLKILKDILGEKGYFKGSK